MTQFEDFNPQIAKQLAHFEASSRAHRQAIRVMGAADNTMRRLEQTVLMRESFMSSMQRRFEQAEHALVAQMPTPRPLPSLIPSRASQPNPVITITVTPPQKRKARIGFHTATAP